MIWSSTIGFQGLAATAPTGRPSCGKRGDHDHYYDDHDYNDDHDHNNDDNHDHDNDDGYERWGWLKKCLDGDDDDDDVDDDVCPNLVFQTLRERDFEPACWGLQEVFPLH